MPTNDETQNESQDVMGELGEEWGGETGADVPDAKPFQESLPPMRALFRIENAFYNRSRKGRKQLNAACVILQSDAGDEFKGKDITKRWGLETPTNLEWLNQNLVALDIPIVQTATAAEDFKRLPSNLVGICFRADLVENEDKQYPPNMYINEGAREREHEGTQAEKY